MLNSTKFANISTLAMIGVLATSPAFGQDKPSISIPQARVDLRVKAAAAQGQADSPELRKTIREELINVEVMAKEAATLGLDKSTEAEQQIEMSKQQVLATIFVQNFTRNYSVSEEQLKHEYEVQKVKLVGNKEYSARHILAGTEAEAKVIIALLDKKANFERLAAKSKDTGSAAQGGLLGWAQPRAFFPEFAKAMIGLKKGEYTKEPVKSQFGWHVIKLEDVRDVKIPTFEEAKPQLQQYLLQQALQKAVADLRAKVKIE